MTEQNYEQLSDEDLALIIAESKSSEYFEILYNRYEKIIYHKCHSFSNSVDEAKDLTQDVFLMLFIKIHTFNRKSKFSSWLYSFTYNFCVNYVNRNNAKKISNLSDSFKEDYVGLPTEASDSSFLEVKIEKLQKALNIISPKDKSILLLKYQDYASIKELQELLEIKESSVKMRLKRARERITIAYDKL